MNNVFELFWLVVKILCASNAVGLLLQGKVSKKYGCENVLLNVLRA